MSPPSPFSVKRFTVMRDRPHRPPVPAVMIAFRYTFTFPAPSEDDDGSDARRFHRYAFVARRKSRDDRSRHVTAVRRRVSANTCCNALDLHVERGRADQPALIYGPLANVVRSYTYRELRDETARFAGALVEGRD